MGSGNWKTVGPATITSSVASKPDVDTTAYTVPVNPVGKVTDSSVMGMKVKSRPTKSTRNKSVEETPDASYVRVILSPG